MSKKKDIPEVEPVETIEEEIQAAIDATEEVVEDEVTEVVEEPVEEAEPAETDDSEHSEDSDTESEEEDVVEEERAEEETEVEEESDEPEEAESLEAPEHWAASDRELFNSQTPEAQEFLLERHKSMEGDYTRKSQDIAAVKRRDDAVQDALAPFANEFAQAGLDQAGAVRQLASWHNAFKTGGKSAILKAAEIYGIDMSETDDQEYTDPAVKALQNQVSELRGQTTRNNDLAQQNQQSQTQAAIQSFEAETNEAGDLKHPHFGAVYNEMVMLFNDNPKYPGGLPAVYKRALLLHPELTVAKPSPKPVKKLDQAEKVKKAKKAATGIRSSGAVSKKSSEGMSLEQELASHF